MEKKEEKEVKVKKYCSAFNCMNTNKTPDISFFTLPRDVVRRRQWLKAIDREDLLEKENLKITSYVVCSDHFEQTDILMVPKLKDTAIPTLSLYKSEREKVSPKCTRGFTAQTTTTCTDVKIEIEIEPIDETTEDEAPAEKPRAAVKALIKRNRTNKTTEPVVRKLKIKQLKRKIKQEKNDKIDSSPSEIISTSPVP